MKRFFSFLVMASFLGLFALTPAFAEMGANNGGTMPSGDMNKSGMMKQDNAMPSGEMNKSGMMKQDSAMPSGDMNKSGMMKQDNSMPSGDMNNTNMKKDNKMGKM